MVDKSQVTVRALTSEELHNNLERLANLRIEVFRSWPYLYDGDAGYERKYLSTYLDSENAFMAGAFDGDLLVGAATAMPLAEHEAAFSKPLEVHGYDTEAFFYFGESVLLEHYRGRGVGVEFFNLREAEATRQGYSKCVFAAVQRPPDHPCRPLDYVPLDAFWNNRGYEKMDGIETSYAWKDVDQANEMDKVMHFWLRSLI